MGKYCGCMTLSQICKEELREAGEIFKRYKMSEDDTSTIESMIIEAYFQLSNSCAAGRANERFLDEVAGIKTSDTKHFGRWMRIYEEEKMKFPFDIYDDEDEETEDGDMHCEPQDLCGMPDR